MAWFCTNTLRLACGLLLFVITVQCYDGAQSQSARKSCSKSGVEITWLGVTMYFVRYHYRGKEVKLLLDDQISKPFIKRAFDDVLSAKGKLDYMFLGHMHFDHDGECPQWLYGEPFSYKCAPFQQQAADYSAKVVAPLYGCKLTHPDTNCTALSPSLQVLDLEEIGLRVTVIPNAHSYLWYAAGKGSRGRPGCHGGITGLNCPDGFAFLFEFPGEKGLETECSSSFFWADTGHDRAPFLEGYSEIGDPKLPPLNYSLLLEQAFQNRSRNARTTLMAFPSSFLPNEEAWQQWAHIVRPHFHTNHHHGESSATYWPELGSEMQGSPLGGPPQATWLTNASVPHSKTGASAYAPTFLPLTDFFDTIRLQGPSIAEKIDLGYAAQFRSSGSTGHAGVQSLWEGVQSLWV